jgi:hypothetical protein
MLTLLVYFSGELWQLAARMTRARLWQVIGFLALIALIFVVTTIRDEVRALREDRAEQSDPRELLVGTPLADRIDHDPVRTLLSRPEQFNVVAVMVVSQAIQVVFFTTGLFVFLLVAVVSGLYFTVSTSVDPLYRQRFFEPLIADVAVSLAGRDAYLEMENGSRN